MTAEEWRPVLGYDGQYEVSNQGRVRSWSRVKQGDLLSPVTVRGGYLQVSLYDEFGRSRVRKVHQVVAEAFIGPCPDGMQTRHLDGNPTRNHVSNLAYGTPAENTRDSIRHGTNAQTRKTRCPQGHPYDKTNTYESRGWRQCWTCKRQRARKTRLDDITTESD